MSKTFKTFNSFSKAIAPLVHKKQKEFISSVLVRMGYATEKIIYSPYYTVRYGLRDGVIPTQEDIEKAVTEINKL